MTYHRDIEVNENSNLESDAGRIAALLKLVERKTSERAASVQALAAFRERAAQIAEAASVSTGHPHEQARVHHRIGADTARKSIAAKIRALPLFEDDETARHTARPSALTVGQTDLRANAISPCAEIDSAKRHLIVGGEL